MRRLRPVRCPLSAQKFQILEFPLERLSLWLLSWLNTETHRLRSSLPWRLSRKQNRWEDSTHMLMSGLTSTVSIFWESLGELDPVISARLTEQQAPRILLSPTRNCGVKDTLWPHPAFAGTGSLNWGPLAYSASALVHSMISLSLLPNSSFKALQHQSI